MHSPAAPAHRRRRSGKLIGHTTRPPCSAAANGLRLLRLRLLLGFGGRHGGATDRVLRLRPLALGGGRHSDAVSLLLRLLDRGHVIGQIPRLSGFTGRLPVGLLDRGRLGLDGGSLLGAPRLLRRATRLHHLRASPLRPSTFTLLPGRLALGGGSLALGV